MKDKKSNVVKISERLVAAARSLEAKVEINPDRDHFSCSEILAQDRKTSAANNGSLYYGSAYNFYLELLKPSSAGLFSCDFAPHGISTQTANDHRIVALCMAAVVAKSEGL